MDADLDSLLTVVFCTADDLLPTPPGNARRMVTDAEVVTLAVAQVRGTHDRELSIPKGVSDLLGGADYGTITGWFRSEIGSIYGPLVIAAVAITGASAATAGEEEDRILALVLAHPIRRSRLVAAKAAAIAAVVVIIALATWAGMIVGVAVGGGGISVGHLAAFSVQLAFFGFATGAVAIALVPAPAADRSRTEPLQARPSSAG